MQSLLDRVLVVLVIGILGSIGILGNDIDATAEMPLVGTATPRFPPPTFTTATMPPTVIGLPPYLQTPTRVPSTPPSFPPPTITTATIPATVVPLPPGTGISLVYLPVIKCNDTLSGIQR